MDKQNDGVLLRVRKIGFLEDDNHTIKYAREAKSWLYAEEEED